MNARPAALFARQPIVTDSMRIVGYELLFRGEGYDSKSFDGDRATTEVLLNAFTELDLESAVNNELAFINYTKPLLSNPPEHFKGQLVIELLETIDVDEEFVQLIATLSQSGYVFALDDFEPGSKAEALIPHIKYIKLDVQALTNDQIQAFCHNTKYQHLTIIAEKIESYEQYEFCRNLGIPLFQGYYFAKPEVMSGENLSPSKLVTLQLLANLSNPKVGFDEIQDIVASDATLTYKLLKLVNSSYYRRATEIESLRHAMVILGINGMRSVVSMLLMVSLNENNPAMQSISLTRAHFMEALAQRLQPDLAAQAFTTAVLSALQQSLGERADVMIASLQIIERIKLALKDRSGLLGSMLTIAIANERLVEEDMDWNLLTSSGIDRSELAEMYIEAVKKADACIRALS
ncbi:EAL and HDOD domain-containing protein [Salinibius halmophilus]|uniref:EAL and HDOD domain-containing protein n=1 Tax=Salinibius halmophilus TaxID=1853216 RepID=UPI000E66713B|nr:HDOD domain-containing protein [Salinibius halmophilus]